MDSLGLHQISDRLAARRLDSKANTPFFPCLSVFSSFRKSAKKWGGPNSEAENSGVAPIWSDLVSQQWGGPCFGVVSF